MDFWLPVELVAALAHGLQRGEAGPFHWYDQYYEGGEAILYIIVIIILKNKLRWEGIDDIQKQLSFFMV